MGIIKDVILHDQEAKKQEPSKYDEALAKYNTDLDDNAVREAVRKIIAEKVPQNDTEEVKKFLFGSIELTTLKTTDSETSVLAFTERVNDFDNEYPELPHVATICVYPCFAKTVAESLEVDGIVALHRHIHDDAAWTCAHASAWQAARLCSARRSTRRWSRDGLW